MSFISNDLLRLPDPSILDSDDELLSSGKVDSLGVMSLLSFVERELGIEIPAEDVTIENFESVNTLDAYLTRLSER